MLLGKKIREKENWTYFSYLSTKRSAQETALIKSQYIKKEADTLKKDVKKINTHEIRKGIVHADLTKDNLLIKGNRLTSFIDWDDAHSGYIVTDFAIFLVHLLLDYPNITINKLKYACHNYKKHFNINEEEKKAIYYLMKMRILGILWWDTYHLENPKTTKKEMQKEINRVILLYKKLNKIGLIEFIKYFDKK